MNRRQLIAAIVVAPIAGLAPLPFGGATHLRWQSWPVGAARPGEWGTWATGVTTIARYREHGTGFEDWLVDGRAYIVAIW